VLSVFLELFVVTFNSIQSWVIMEKIFKFTNSMLKKVFQCKNLTIILSTITYLTFRNSLNELMKTCLLVKVFSVFTVNYKNVAIFSHDFLFLKVFFFFFYFFLYEIFKKETKRKEGGFFVSRSENRK